MTISQPHRSCAPHRTLEPSRGGYELRAHRPHPSSLYRGLSTVPSHALNGKHRPLLESGRLRTLHHPEPVGRRQDGYDRYPAEGPSSSGWLWGFSEILSQVGGHSMIRILIVDDHPVVRRGLKQIVSEQSPLLRTGGFSSSADGCEFSPSSPNDLLGTSGAPDDIPGCFQAWRDSSLRASAGGESPPLKTFPPVPEVRFLGPRSGRFQEMLGRTYSILRENTCAV